MRYRLIFLLLSAALLLVAPALLRANTHRRPALTDYPSAQAIDYEPDHILVQLRPGVQTHTLSDQPLIPLFGNWYRLPLPNAESAPAAVQRLRGHPAVLHAELDLYLHIDQSTDVATATPNDPFFPFQWNMPAIGAPSAWPQNAGQGVIVAILDTGISLGPDLACHTLVAPFDATTISSDPLDVVDTNGHGTHVAGTIAQCTNNATGLTGVAFGSSLMPVKVCTSNGACSLSAIAAGIDWAVEHDAQVINMSLGASCEDFGDWPNCSATIVNEAIDRAVAANVILVAASGNGNDDVVGFPANHPEVLAVGAIDASHVRANYSNFGTALTLVAPGGLTDDPNGGILQETLGSACGIPAPFALCSFQGTSMAAPHVAGAVAILRSSAPTASRTEIQAALIDTAQDLGPTGFDPFYGHGLIQIPAALAALGVNPLPPAIYVPFVAMP